MNCFVLWIAVIGEKASKYRDDRRYRDLTQATVRSCLIMSSQQDGTWAAVPTNLYHMTTPDPVEPKNIHRNPKTTIREKNCCGIMAYPLHNGVIRGHFTRFSGQGNYPQAGGTRPFRGETWRTNQAPALLPPAPPDCPRDEALHPRMARRVRMLLS